MAGGPCVSSRVEARAARGAPRQQRDAEGPSRTGTDSGTGDTSPRSVLDSSLDSTVRGWSTIFVGRQAKHGKWETAANPPSGAAGCRGSDQPTKGLRASYLFPPPCEPQCGWRLSGCSRHGHRDANQAYETAIFPTGLRDGTADVRAETKIELPIAEGASGQPFRANLNTPLGVSIWLWALTLSCSRYRCTSTLCVWSAAPRSATRSDGGA